MFHGGPLSDLGYNHIAKKFHEVKAMQAKEVATKARKANISILDIVYK